MAFIENDDFIRNFTQIWHLCLQDVVIDYGSLDCVRVYVRVFLSVYLGGLDACPFRKLVLPHCFD